MSKKTVKKPAAKKSASMAKPSAKSKVKATPSGKPLPAKKEAENAEEAGDEMMTLIDAHAYGTSKVGRRDSLDYYQYLVTECQSRIETIEAELESEGESEDDGELVDTEGDDDDDDEDEEDGD